MEGFFPVFVNVVLPVLAGLVFFALARYIKHIAPLRTLVTGQLTYSGGHVSFLLFGIYLATRPLQILLGPYPMPLIVNNIREFFMIGFFGPAVLIAILSLVFGSESVPRMLLGVIVGFGLMLAMAFVVINIFAIGGSEEIFRIGRWVAYDGIWFKNSDVVHEKLMHILFMIRFIDPVLMVSLAGFLAIWHAQNYPVEKKKLYDNMPNKLALLGAACFTFSLSMLFVGLIYLFAHIANQWWIYYVGALASGFLETFSLAMPLRKSVVISEHDRTLS